MRFYTKPHQFYCGIDLHARLLAVCIVDASGNIVLQKQLPAEKQLLLDVLAPFGPTWSSPSNVCSPGTGSPICAGTRRFPSCSATPST